MESRSVSLRDRILAAAAAPLPNEMVPLPELDCIAYVRAMSGRERDAFDLACMADLRRGLAPKVRARLVALCTVDANGQSIFTSEDVEALGQLRADVLDRLTSVAQRLSGFATADIAALTKPTKAAHAN